MENAQTAEQMDLFIKKVYRNAAVFAEIISEESRAYYARIVYARRNTVTGCCGRCKTRVCFP
ncbi:MAG: hypothetical protein LBG43_06350 [Treponema sp.]|nr:hypothetical protein [Treponema sp.]